MMAVQGYMIEVAGYGPQRCDVAAPRRQERRKTTSARISKQMYGWGVRLTNQLIDRLVERRYNFLCISTVGPIGLLAKTIGFQISVLAGAGDVGDVHACVLHRQMQGDRVARSRVRRRSVARYPSKAVAFDIDDQRFARASKTMKTGEREGVGSQECRRHVRITRDLKRIGRRTTCKDRHTKYQSPELAANSQTIWLSKHRSNLAASERWQLDRFSSCLNGA